jgi:hypothetical protein
LLLGVSLFALLFDEREAFFERRKRKNERVGSFSLLRVLGKKREERVSPGTEEEKSNSS